MSAWAEQRSGSGAWAERRLAASPAADMLLAAALGALQTLAYVHTAAWALQLLCIAGLAWRVQAATPRRAALLGAAFGTTWVASGVWWLFISMHRYGGLPAPLAAAAVLLLALVLSGYLAVATAAAARARRGHWLADAGLFTLAWLATELARGLIFSGFPWIATGYAQIDSPLAAWAPWIGVYGIGALVAWAAALLAGAVARGWRIAAPGLLGSVVLLGLPALIGPGEFTRATGSLKVTLLQANVPQDEKFVIERLPATLAWVAAALQQAQGDLVIAPETAVPLLPEQLNDFDPRYWPQLREHFRRPGAPAALLGVPLGDFQSGYTNSVLALDAAGTPYRYDKTHLVPFGEFIPTGFRWFTEMMNIPLGDFARGPLNAPSYALRGERVAPNICYEDLFGEELALRFTDPATAPTVLANLSNIGWFGDTIAVTQHLQISRMRTLELQRPMLRATNTGATVIIDHRAHVSARLPPFTRGALSGEVQGRSGRTPYVAWVGTIGLWPLLLAAWLALALLAWRAGQGAPGKLAG
ncbi:apolipoprotein N-acyltransferase [Aquabacterium sp.]|uniref:apolipoprotein N-acyltransferase n=1 Tax=Aquabacterium sp. TaxID=1872578 RepID=UPI002C971F53|nr:apolipoprotein N-acyltransferase [Aquabacterium sp.]HSW05401.1 apolipoprotein N-acyltransferase [Aquabacterium sp.]